MNITSILNGISIGKDTSGNFKLTPEGLAVRTTLDGDFFVNKRGRLLDVSDLTLEGVDPYVYRLPVQRDDLKEGDLIITSENPFAVLFVLGKRDRGLLSGLDPGSRQEIEYSPPTNALVQVQLYVKVVSLLDTISFQSGGNPLLPLLLLGDQGSASNSDSTLTLLLLSQTLGGKAIDNKLLPFLLLKGGSAGSIDNLLLMLALTGGANPFEGLFGSAVAETSKSKASDSKKSEARLE